MAVHWGECSEVEDGVLLRFGDPLGLTEGLSNRTLVWTRETSPEVIEEVAVFIAKRGLVVTDLELAWSFMEDDGQLVRWLVGLANRTPVFNYWVNAEGVDEERQRRVRALLEREVRLQKGAWALSSEETKRKRDGKSCRFSGIWKRFGW